MTEEIWIQGSAVSSGIAIGLPLFLQEKISHQDNPEKASVQTVESEIQKFRQVVSQNQAELRELTEKLIASNHIQEADLVEGSLLLATDPIFLDLIEVKIRAEEKTALQAIQEVRAHLKVWFDGLAEPYLRQRFEDIQGICDRFIALLISAKPGEVPLKISVDSILCACVVTAPLAAQVSVNGIGAMVTKCGGSMSHTAIIAKSRGIPYVSDIDIAHVEKVSPNHPVIVDGGAGVVILQPTEETVRRYINLKKMQGDGNCAECELTPAMGMTKDRYPIKLLANVAKENDIYQVSQYFLDGVGLYRTEYQVLEKRRIPSEKEQVEAYSGMARASRGRPFVIRVFDFGSDKGWEEVLEKIPARAQKKRALSLLLECEDLLRSQLRAILLASRLGPLSILFPMVSSLIELNSCLDILQEVYQEVSAEGSLPFPRVGAMLEMPSILFHMKEVAQRVDFLSLGTNDLIQYAFAVDRSNTAVFDYRISFHPGLMHLVRYVAAEAKRMNMPLCICGEMASDPLLVPFLVGVGVTEFSIAPRSAPVVRKVLHAFTKSEMEKMAEKVLQARSAQEVYIILRSYYAIVNEAKVR